jgi:hypothetical protein
MIKPPSYVACLRGASKRILTVTDALDSRLFLSRVQELARDRFAPADADIIESIHGGEDGASEACNEGYDDVDSYDVTTASNIPDWFVNETDMTDEQAWDEWTDDNESKA